MSQVPYGEWVTTVSDARAFIPRRLPAEFAWTPKLTHAVIEAQTCLGRLSGLGHRFRHPERLIRMFLRREAEYSSRIERTYAGVRTLVLFDLVKDVREQSPDVLEVENNYKVLKFVCETAGTIPITLASLRHMQAMLFEGVQRPPQVVGDFRRLQNWIGASGNIHEARYVPPPPTHVRECLEGLLEFIRTPDELPPVVRCAMVHYQFESIHPFDDGNGRIGRALILSQLLADKAIPLPLLNPSAQLERQRQAYYDLLHDVSVKGAWEEWIRYFSNCVTAECRRSIQILERLDVLRHDYLSKVGKARQSALILRLVDHLFGEPAVNVPTTADILGVTKQSAQRLLEKLQAAHIVEEVTGQRRNRVYLANQIVDVFSERTDQGDEESST